MMQVEDAAMARRLRLAMDLDRSEPVRRALDEKSRR